MKKWILPAVCTGVSLIGAFVCMGYSAVLSGRQYSQQAAERWAQDSEIPYAQVSAFFNVDAGCSESSIASVREKVNTALLQASMESDPEHPLWYDAYSTEMGTVKVHGVKNGTVSTTLTAVGGEFFLLHPMTLEDGTYLRPDDLMQDRVVIDSTVAWHTFGTSEVAGMELTVDGKIYQIAGVVRPEDDPESTAAYGDTPRLYLPFAALAAGVSGEENAGSTVKSVSVGCYEAVLPNPVRGFSMKLLTDAFGERDGMELLQNTNRDSLSRRWETLRHLRRMVVASDGISYPYWENAARMSDFTQARLLLWEMLLLVLPAVLVLVLLWKAYRFAGSWIRKKREARKRKFRTIEKDPFSV